MTRMKFSMKKLTGFYARLDSLNDDAKETIITMIMAMLLIIAIIVAVCYIYRECTNIHIMHYGQGLAIEILNKVK